jgi:hypothetical protein
MLAVGLISGLLDKRVSAGPQYNAAAAIFARGLAETAYLVQALGGGLNDLLQERASVCNNPGWAELRMGRLSASACPAMMAVGNGRRNHRRRRRFSAVMPAIEEWQPEKIDMDAFHCFRPLQIIARSAPVGQFERFFNKLPFSPPE